MKKKKFPRNYESPFGENSLVESLKIALEIETVHEDVPKFIVKPGDPKEDISDFEKIPMTGRDFLAQTFNRFKKIMKEKLRVS